MTRTKVTPRRSSSFVTFAGVAVALALLLLPLSFFGYSRAGMTMEDAGHAPLFALATWWFLRLQRSKSRGPVRISNGLWICFAVIAAGGLTEIAQWFTGRDASWTDWANDALGSVTAFCFVALRMGDPRGARKAMLISAILASVVIYLLPVTVMAMAYHRRYQQFPALYAFQYGSDRYFVNDLYARSEIVPGEQCGTTRGPAMNSLRVELSDKPASGVLLDEPSADWRYFSQLYLDIANPSDHAITLTLLLGDKTQNFGLGKPLDQLTLPRTSGVRRYVIPLAAISPTSEGRMINLASMRQIVLFRAQPGESDRFCVSQVGLQ